MCWYHPSEARAATLLSCLGLLLAVRTVAFAMSGIPPSQAAGEAARGFQRDPFRPGGGRVSKTNASAATAAAAASARGEGASSPSHLVVLVHGLGGTPEDLSYLKESLDRRGGEGVLVHLARCNQGKTKDGVAMGGERLAKEIRWVVERTPSLCRISLVGNSLGGLYVRYAVKLLYRADGGGAAAAAGEAAGAAVAAVAAEVAVGGGGGGGVKEGGSTDGFSATASTATVTAATTETDCATATSTSTAAAAQTSKKAETETVTATVTSPAAAAAAAAARGSSTSKAPEEGHVPPASSSPVGEGGAAVAAAREGETVAGLKPSVFMTIASPHLGVRRFTYVPLPTPLHSLASVFVGKTGSDLFLERNDGSSAALLPPPPPSPSLSPSAISSAVRRYFSLFPEASGGKAVGKEGPGSGTEARARAGVGAGTGVTAGKVGREASLLYEMATSEEFLTPLKAFRWRRAYANRRGDFMVPYGTAAFVSPGEGDGSETTTMTTPPAEVTLAGVVGGSGAGAVAVGAGVGQGKDAREGAWEETEEVDTGATASEFTVVDRVLGAKHGAIVGMARVPPAAPARAMVGSGARNRAGVGVGTRAGVGAAVRSGDNGGDAGLRDEGGGETAGAGVAVAARVAVAAVAAGVAASGGGERPVRPGRTRIFVRSKASARTRGRKSMEEEMADGLNSCGWEKVSVDFGGLAPFSHNKICALSRGPLTRAVFRSGKTIVDHAANFLVSYDLKEDLKDGAGGGGSHGG